MSGLWENEEAYDEWRKKLDERNRFQSNDDEVFLSGTQEMEDFADLEPLEWKSGYIWGPAGVGKTYTASRMLKFVAGTFVTARGYINLARMVELDRADEDDARRFRRIRGFHHLLLDDLGTRKPSDFAYEAIYDLIDCRMKYQYPTIVTSNVSLDQLAAIYDDRVASRIATLGEVVHMTGIDRRINR